MKRIGISGLLLLLSINTAMTQDVIDVMDNTVFFEKVGNVGNEGDEKLIVRNQGETRTPIAKVKIEKLGKDIVVADVTAIKPGYSVSIGDEVFDRPDDLQSVQAKSYHSTRRVRQVPLTYSKYSTAGTFGGVFFWIERSIDLTLCESLQ